MSRLILLNKPYGVLCQFTDEAGRPTLKDCVPVPGVYAAGRLDTDSEGLLLLTDDGALQHRIADPRHKLPKTYLVQVEGEADEAALAALRRGVDLGDFRTRPCEARRVAEPDWLWPRDPPVRFRKSVPTAWLEIVLREGKNRPGAADDREGRPADAAAGAGGDRALAARRARPGRVARGGGAAGFARGGACPARIGRGG